MYRATPPHRWLLTNRFHVVLATRRLVPPSPTGICRRVKVSAALRCFRTLCFKQHLSRFIVVYGYKLFSFATNDVKSGVVTLKLNDDDGRVVRVTTKYRHHCTMYLISSLRGQTDRHFQLKLIISERPNFAVAFRRCRRRHLGNKSKSSGACFVYIPRVGDDTDIFDAAERRGKMLKLLTS